MGFRGEIRGATGADHDAFARLFPELGVDDPILDRERFAREVAPHAVVAIRDADGQTVGFGSYRILGTTAHVVHVITAPDARRSGVGTAIMRAIGERTAAAGCTSWYLNTLENNEPARALYGSLGFTPSFLSHALRVPWSVIDGHDQRPHPASASVVVVRPFDPAEDQAIEGEPTCALVGGQLASARSTPGRVMRVLLEDDAYVGVACFDPTFPGVHPFRVARPDLARPLLAALRPYARPTDELVHVVVENRTDIADYLLAAGATLRLTTLRMNATLPIPTPAPTG